MATLRRYLHAACLSATAIAILNFGIAQPASADPQADMCLGASGQQPAPIAEFARAKKSLALGHAAAAKEQAQIVEAAARQCIADSYQADGYRLLLAYGMLMEGQARLALGDAHGADVMKQGIVQANAVAQNAQVNPDVRRMARDAAYGGEQELNGLKTARPGQLITPPPTAPP